MNRKWSQALILVTPLMIISGRMAFASQALMLTVRARALLDGRLAPNAEDVLDMARPVLSHRMALNFAARARGDSLADLIESVASELAGSRAAA